MAQSAFKSPVTGVAGSTGPTGLTGGTGPTGSTGSKPAGQIWLSAAGMWSSITSGAAANAQIETPTNKVNYFALDFADSGTLSAEATVVMPSDWDGGTVTAVFYWTGITDVTTNAVVWGIAGRSFTDGDLIDQAYPASTKVTDNNASTANQLRVSAATGAATITGAAASDLVQFLVQRFPGDAGDTLGVTARLLGVMINYTRV